MVKCYFCHKNLTKYKILKFEESFHTRINFKPICNDCVFLVRLFRREFEARRRDVCNNIRCFISGRIHSKKPEKIVNSDVVSDFYKTLRKFNESPYRRSEVRESPRSHYQSQTFARNRQIPSSSAGGIISHYRDDNNTEEWRMDDDGDMVRSINGEDFELPPSPLQQASFESIFERNMAELRREIDQYNDPHSSNLPPVEEDPQVENLEERRQLINGDGSPYTPTRHERSVIDTIRRRIRRGRE